MTTKKPRRYSAARLDTDLRRIIRALAAEHPERPRPLAELAATRSIAVALESITDRLIIAARRNDTDPYPWAAIGVSLGVSGQAVGQRARVRDLAVTRVDLSDP